MQPSLVQRGLYTCQSENGICDEQTYAYFSEIQYKQEPSFFPTNISYARLMTRLSNAKFSSLSLKLTVLFLLSTIECLDLTGTKFIITKIQKLIWQVHRSNKKMENCHLLALATNLAGALEILTYKTQVK